MKLSCLLVLCCVKLCASVIVLLCGSDGVVCVCVKLSGIGVVWKSW